MKTLMSLSLLTFSLGAFAAPKLCPNAEATLYQCTSKDVVPMYPYLAVCQDDRAQMSMVLDSGIMQRPTTFEVIASREERAEVFTATYEDADGLRLLVDPTSKEAVLEFNLWGMPQAFKFKCKGSNL